MKMVLTLTLIWILSSTTLGWGGKDSVSRGCRLSTDCTTKTVSHTVGSMIAASSTRCCNTDLCNDHKVPYPDVTTKNGLQCISCMEPKDPECKLIDCVGEQDRCFESFPKDKYTSHVRGCASAGFCEALYQSSQMSNSVFTRAPICNSAWKVKLSVAPLLLGLVVLVVL
ncbi:urokinase plasminogen activator surface receptor-like isoform X2 [Mugil cephalus]|uniref:urokinase plasminogen activator surface receptor-like isoform X2 n=1 Tax=Mugil cephalus TaxID=48193 RepID=UPI001FB8303B|nr:urokinase plasminogen activator surface receptor-like isoform X2 [Mugil cephalus]